ncbi:MAG: hypothetical protein ABI744_00725 [Chloroflexota bacterium]
MVAANLALYDLAWTHGPKKPVELDCEFSAGIAEAAARGDYLEAARMRVDRTPTGMRATTDHGAVLEGMFTEDSEHWRMRVPDGSAERGLAFEIEDLLSLVLTTGWRRAGWVPLHAAAVTDGVRGILVCAASGGGKTTFMLALVRAGWKALGDDKLLLRSDGAGSFIVGIKHMLNVDPSVDAWFPEIGDLRGLPEYSAWTPKRRIGLSSLWPDSPAFAMRPTTVISLERRPGPGAMSAEEMDPAATIGTMLRQTVIPRDPDEARWITRELAACARGTRGIRLVVGDQAYVDPSSIDAFARQLS